MLFGIALCFFGGAYAATFAAVEAFRKMGWERFYKDVLVVREQAELVAKASEEDDDQDTDGNQIADVDELQPHELLKRKTAVAMKAITEPELLQKAIGSLWAALLAVFATLKLQFAATVAIGLGIAEMLTVPFTAILAPMLAIALGKDLKHWAHTIIDVIVSVIAVIIAWQLQMIISAFYSGLRGGRLIGSSFFELWNTYAVPAMPHWMPGFMRRPVQVDETYLDELLGFLFFGVGFTSQILSWFNVPFPFNIILLPVTAFEYFLRYEITFADTSQSWPPLS